MSKFAIGLFTLAVYATSLVAVPMVTPARAAADSSKQMKKHKKIHRSPGSPMPGHPRPTRFRRWTRIPIERLAVAAAIEPELRMLGLARC
jgi:hypothetical protein